MFEQTFKNIDDVFGKRPVELTGANQDTLKVRLRELVNAGRLQRHGKGRATWYRI